MTSIRNGIAANGFSTIVAGLAGGIGGNTQSSGIGMSNAAGVTSRWVAYWLGGMLIVCSFIPVVCGILVAGLATSGERGTQSLLDRLGSGYYRHP
jgi:xanthine/uracil permease